MSANDTSAYDPGISPLRRTLVPQVDLSSKFYDGVFIERQLDPIEYKLLALTEKSARRHGFHNLLDYLGGIPEEVLRRQVKLKDDAKALGIHGTSFHSFLDFLNYCKKIAHHKPVNKDFFNDMLIAGNTIALRVQDLFNAGEVVSTNGVRQNGIFGKQGIVKRERDLSWVDDLMPFLYTVHSTIAKGNPPPAYFLFFGETPNPVQHRDALYDTSKTKIFLEYNSGPWFNANLALERMEKFIDEAIGMSLDITSKGVLLIDHKKKPYFLPLVSAIYDLDSMTMWRVERISGHIYAQRLDEWFLKNIDTMVYPEVPLFSRRDIIEKHIDRLSAHANHGSEHMQLRQNYLKKVGCVDGRQDNSKSEIGCLIGEKQLENLVSDNNTTRIRFSFHTECGYVITAVSLHKIFRGLKAGIDPNDTMTVERARLFIEVLTKKPWISRDEQLFTEFVRHVDLSKVSPHKAVQQHFFNQLSDLWTDNQGSLRYATSHMLDRQVFQIEHGYPVMTAAKNVEESLAKHNLPASDHLYLLFTTEELVRLDRTYKQAWLATNGDRISRERVDGTAPKFEWMIEDFVTGRYFSVSDTFIKDQAKDDIVSVVRTDAVTGKAFDVSRERALRESTGLPIEDDEFHLRKHNHDHDHDH